jgi:hypothetical protein
MPSPATAAPRASFFTGRAKWFWIAVAGALGLWLIVMLVVSDEPAISEREAPKSPLEQLEQTAGPTLPHFEEKATKAFRQRREVRSSRPSSAVPFWVDDGQGK